MGLLSNFESRVSAAVESTFGRVFRSKVRPVEIARKLTKEIERSRSVSVSKTYAPNSFTVYLSAGDYKQLQSYEHELTGELVTYLLEYARRENLTLTRTPVVSLELDERLKLGEFGVSATEGKRSDSRLAELSAATKRPAVKQPAAGSQTEIYSRASRLQPAGEARSGAQTLCIQGPHGLLPLTTDPIVIGRSKEVDLVLDDPGISRRHAKLSWAGHAWQIEDLGSTNGVCVNGEKITTARELKLGDSVELSKIVLRVVERSKAEG